MLTAHHAIQRVPFAGSNLSVAPPLSKADSAWETVQRGAWQLGVDLFCAATGVKSVGIVVLQHGVSGIRVVAELGQSMNARAVWLHDMSDVDPRGSSSWNTRGWKRIVAPAPRDGDDPGPAELCLWGCKLLDVAGHRAYMGLLCDRPLTDMDLHRVATHSGQFGRALETDLCAPGSEPAMAEPFELARQAKLRFGLTDAEHMVLRELLSGTPAKRIATCRDVAVSTVRSQIKSIYGKLDVHRLSQIYARLQQPVAASRVN